MKNKIIKKLEEDGYLPDEAQRIVENSWWIIEIYKELAESILEDIKK